MLYTYSREKCATCMLPLCMQRHYVQQGWTTVRAMAGSVHIWRFPKKGFFFKTMGFRWFQHWIGLMTCMIWCTPVLGNPHIHIDINKHTFVVYKYNPSKNHLPNSKPNSSGNTSALGSFAHEGSPEKWAGQKLLPQEEWPNQPCANDLSPLFIVSVIIFRWYLLVLICFNPHISCFHAYSQSSYPVWWSFLSLLQAPNW